MSIKTHFLLEKVTLTPCIIPLPAYSPLSAPRGKAFSRESPSRTIAFGLRARVRLKSTWIFNFSILLASSNNRFVQLERLVASVASQQLTSAARNSRENCTAAISCLLCKLCCAVASCTVCVLYVETFVMATEAEPAAEDSLQTGIS